MGVRTAAKVFFCAVETGEEVVLAITDETWLAYRRRRSGRERGDAEYGGDGTPVEEEAGVVDGLDSFVV